MTYRLVCLFCAFFLMAKLPAFGMHDQEFDDEKPLSLPEGALEELEKRGLDDLASKVRETLADVVDHTQYFVDLLRSEDHDSFLSGVLSLVAVEKKAASGLDVVRDILKNDEKRNVYMLDIIQSIGPDAKDAVPDVISFLTYDENLPWGFHPQYFACRALAAIGEDAVEAVPVLIDRLEKGVPSVRRNAAIALGAIGPAIGEEGIRSLEKALFAYHHPVRLDATVALGRIGPAAKSTIPKLIEAFEFFSEDLTKLQPYTQPQAAIAIYRISGDLTYFFKLSDPKYDEQIITAQKDYLAVFEEIGEKAVPAFPNIVRDYLKSEGEDGAYRRWLGLSIVNVLEKHALPLREILVELKDQETNEELKECFEIVLKKL